MSSAVYNANGNVSAHLLPLTICSAAKMLKYQNIAPAPTSDGKPRKYTPRATNVPYGVDQTHSVQRRNARERNRVKQVNNSYARLRQHIPQTIIADLTKGGGRGPQKKISKVDTLRIAVEYIRRLQDLIDDLNSNCGSSDTLSNSSYGSGSTAGSPPPSQLYFAHATSALQQQQQQQQLQQQPQHLPTTLFGPLTLNSYSPRQTQLDTSCYSPTSSFNSNMSFDSGTFEPPQQQQQQLSPQHAASNNHSHVEAHLQLKFDNFELHEEDCCPPDEEDILDYISLWQEQ